MKTASVREVRQNFGKLLSWVHSGEEVTVTLRRKAVARIVPIIPETTKSPHWPDFAARQKKIFGGKIFPDIVTAERETYKW